MNVYRKKNQKPTNAQPVCSLTSRLNIYHELPPLPRNIRETVRTPPPRIRQVWALTPVASERTVQQHCFVVYVGATPGPAYSTPSFYGPSGCATAQTRTRTTPTTQKNRDEKDDKEDTNERRRRKRLVPKIDTH